MASVDQWAELISASQRAGSGGQQGEQLELAVRLGLGVTPEAVGCSITEIIDGQRYSTVVASNPLALELDLAQYAGGAGPCMRAALTGEIQHIDQMESDRRFGEFATVAFDRGVNCSMSLPLPGVPRPAALNFYATNCNGFDSPRSRTVAALLARCTAALLGQTAADYEPALTSARANGAVVLEAEDLLMRDGLNRAQAFNRLVAASTARSVPVRVVAGELVGDR